VKTSSAIILRTDRMSENYNFFLSTQPIRTKICFIIHVTVLALASGNSSMDPTSASGVGIQLGRGLSALDNIANLAHAIESELARLQAPHSNSNSDSNMALKLCREVVSRSIQQLSYVRSVMSISTMTTDQASSAKMAVTTANTCFRTCRQALDEAGEDSRGSFGTVISLLTAAGAVECCNSQIIYQAITEIPKAPPKQGKKVQINAS
jgi:hypothetical protein